MLDQLDDPIPFRPSPELIAAAKSRGSRLRRRRRLGMTGAMIPVILVLALVAGAVYVDQRFDQVQRVDVAAGVLAPVAPGAAFNILIVGTDASEGLDAGAAGPRSDTIMILHVDESGRVLRLLSLPRDLVFQDGGSTTDRLNTFLPSGGPDALIAAIHDHLGIDIAHYVAIDFVGFEKLVDAVGGIRVQPSAPLRDANTGLDIDASCQHLDGNQVLQLVRSRHLEQQDADGTWVSDPTGDLGRIDRQDDVLRLLSTRLMTSFGDPTRLNGLLDVFAENTTVDAGFDRSTMLKLANLGPSGGYSYTYVLTLPVDPFTTPSGTAVLHLGAGAPATIDALVAPVPQGGAGAADPGEVPTRARSSAVTLAAC
jgi:polyisoprenyl-teichoic acid--peptidoglycan teichoic acid transferase